MPTAINIIAKIVNTPTGNHENRSELDETPLLPNIILAVKENRQSPKRKQ